MSLSKEYTLPKHIRYNAMDSIFNNDFDLSWHRQSQSYRETITKSEINTGVIDDGTVEYLYNKNFFRCSEFTKTPSRPHILFAGCSQTEGIGGNLNTVWPTMFLNKSNIADKSLYNLARSGWGWQMIIYNLHVYVERYTKPDYLFILLPNISRRFEFDTYNKGDYCYMQRYPESDLPKINDVGDISKNEYFVELINFSVFWKFFLHYCKTNNINVLWSTWFFNDLENLKTLNMLDDSYVPLDLKGQSEYVAEMYLSGWEKTEYDLKKRDGHAGTLINMYYADRFLEVAKEKWNVF